MAIICNNCGHSINEHSTACSHRDVVNPATWITCKCKESANDIAVASKAALREAARKYYEATKYGIAFTWTEEQIESRNKFVALLNETEQV